MKRTEKNVLIVAGEASGDLHGSNLVHAMRGLNSGITVRGIGGKNMEEAGVGILVPASDVAVVGLTEVLSRLSSIVRAHLKLRSLLKNSPTDLLVLIDFPDFNISLARTAKRCGVPVLYYISPQIWAWREGRIRKIARRVDRMAVILPFEKEFYLNHGMDVDYVGHPLLDSVPHSLDKGEIVRELELENGRPIVGLLPGSRCEEIRNLLPMMIGAAEILASRYPDLKCILPVAPTISSNLIQPLISRSVVDIRISRTDIYQCLSACDLALVTSGTATLETAIMGVPMVIVYRVSPVTYWIGKMVVNVPYVGLVNLVAGDEIVPELIQNEVTPVSLADHAFGILEDERRKADIMRGLRMVREKLGSGGASVRTAEIAIEMMEGD